MSTKNFNSLIHSRDSMTSPVPVAEASGCSDFNGTLAERYRQLNNSSAGQGEAQTGNPPIKRTRIISKKSSNRLAEIPTLRYSDLGGLESVLEEIRDVVERPFRHHRLYRYLGVEPPRGVLLHGAPGCGKTSLALAIAGELGVPLIRVAAPELVAGMSGESEERIRELFQQANKLAPCLLFIDEVDAVGGKRDAAPKEMERRMVAQLLACMDDLSNVADEGSNDNGKTVMVIGATNRPDSLDPALRRAGRFDREIQLTIPNEAGRRRILEVLTRKLRLAGNIDLAALARHTPGFVGADLRALCQEAAAVAIRRILGDPHININNGEWTEEQLEGATIVPEDFSHAARKIQPSAKREGFATVPDVRWEDIGALQSVREELRLAIVEPLRHPERFEAVGLTAPAGVLLWGPPGCGKTLLAKAVASETHSNFISIKGPELLSKYVGESERAVRQVFERARHSAPCVVFFDELDALCPRRGGGGGDEGETASSRVVNQLLTELDGLEGRRQVFVLAATNRPDMIDPAMTRPGRLDKLLFVNLPVAEERAEILRTLSRRTPWSSDVDLNVIARDPRAEKFSGADLAALVREASLAAIRDSIIDGGQGNSNNNGMVVDETPIQVTMIHAEIALSKVRPSVSLSDLAKYERLRHSK